MEKKLDNLVNPLVRQLKKNEATLHKIIDRLSFPQIFIIYIIFIIIGGFAFYYNPFPGAALKAPAGNVDLTIGDAVYFSFIAATSTGFGDIVPVGANRFIAIFEVPLHCSSLRSSPQNLLVTNRTSSLVNLFRLHQTKEYSGSGQLCSFFEQIL